MHPTFRCVTATIMAVGSLLWAASPGAGETQGDRPYEPTWESLTKHPDPKWFADARFGIYFHWGVYSVPAYSSEWYSRNMYIGGHPANKHHLEKHGPLSRFGYKDFIPMFKAEKFDPDEWAALFKKAGAQFAGPVAEHADGFAMWDSKISKWNATNMGPKRDIVGAMEKAIRKQDMKFITTFHHQWLWAWYPTYDKTCDASNPEYADLYGPFVPKGGFSKPEPDPAFCERWEAKVKEVIDKYQPDLIWFDSRLNTIHEPYRKDLLAYYYNQGAKWGREVGVTYKGKDLPVGAGIVDLERGRMSGLTEYAWLNDDSIDWKSWCDIQDADYKSADRLVDGLVDIVSKNGNLLLNIPPKANGEIPQPVKERLLEMGAWLAVNGEAIYGTRPWEIFGEGPTKVKEGSFGEQKIGDFTAADIRFTTKGNALYAICLDWPGKELKITSINSTNPLLAKEKIASIRMLGADKHLEWSLDGDGLRIVTPERGNGKYAFTFKIALK